MTIEADADVSRRRFFASGGLAAVGAAVILTAQNDAVRAQQNPGQATTSEFAWGDSIRRIKSAGKMVFAMSGGMIPPQYYRDPTTGQPTGFDAEVARAIAKDLGVEPEFEDAVVAARIIGLQSGKYDVVMGGTANSPVRAESIAFTRGYIPYQQVLIVKADSKITTIEDLNDPKYTVTMQIGSTAEYAARQLFPKANLKPLQINEAMLEVASGRADADLVEMYLGGPFVAKQPSTKLLGGPGGKPLVTATEYGCLACRASDMALRQWLDNWLYWYDSHGILPGMYERIMGSSYR